MSHNPTRFDSFTREELINRVVELEAASFAVASALEEMLPHFAGAQQTIVQTSTDHLHKTLLEEPTAHKVFVQLTNGSPDEVLAAIEARGQQDKDDDWYSSLFYATG